MYWEKQPRGRHPTLREKAEIETETQIKGSASDGKRCSWSSVRGVDAIRICRGL